MLTGYTASAHVFDSYLKGVWSYINDETASEIVELEIVSRHADFKAQIPPRI